MRYDAERMGENLRRCRGKKTMEEVASIIGISRSALQMYESGKRVPRDEVKMRIAEYYGQKVSTLFYFE